MVQLGATYLEGTEGKPRYPAHSPQHLTEQYLPPGLPLIKAVSFCSQGEATAKNRLVLPVPTEKLTHERF